MPGSQSPNLIAFQIPSGKEPDHIHTNHSRAINPNGNSCEFVCGRSYFRSLLTLLAGHKFSLSGILAASLAINFLGLILPRVTQLILDEVVPTKNTILLGQLILAVLAVTAFQITLTVWRRLALVRLSLDIDRNILGGLCSYMLSLPLAFFRDHRGGDLLSRFQDNQHVRYLIAGSFTRVVIDSVMILVYVGVMFTYDIVLTLIVLTPLACFAVYTLWMSDRLKKQQRRFLEDKAYQESHLLEVFTGIDLVKAMALEKPMQARWQQALSNFLQTNYATQRFRQFLESGGTAIQCVSHAGWLGYAAMLIVEEKITTGQMVAFGLYASQVLGPILGLISLWEEAQQARASLDRIQEVLNHPAEMHAIAPPSIVPLTGHIRVENVSFSYSHDRGPALRGLQFEVLAGERLAIVGASGSGKSTLLRLLLGLYQPTHGRILIDGIDLAEVDLRDYRRQVGTVFQENLLISGTFQEIITLGDADPDLARMMEMSHLTGAHEFITALPHEYQTKVGEMGLTLSGGQRQRLCLARALYRDPCLLILDEATSALDKFGVRKLQKNLESHLEGRTVIMVAHHPAEVSWADKILVLQDGQIVEEGCHQELLVIGKTYSRLFYPESL